MAADATTSVCAVEDPQDVLAMTEITPPAADGVVVMVLLVEVPIQPPGKDQV
jgi:hypothetical protein